METMKAVVCTRYGPPEVLEIVDVARPIPKKNQVLVKVRAASVNSGDVRVRALNVGTGIRGALIKIIFKILVGFKGPRKKILGMVLAGEVVAVGESMSSFAVGERVYAMTGLQFGTFAEYATLSEKQTVTHMPSKASYEEAAALPFGGTTALYFLRKAGVENAKNALVYGSTGAVGTAAVQVARYYGAAVTAFCGEDGIELSKQLGADTVYNYKEQSVADSSGQFDIVFDAVGKTSKSEIAHLLSPGGTFVTVGGMDTASETVSDMRQLAAMFDEGTLRAVIDKVYPLNEMVEAQRYVETGHKKGAVIVTMSHHVT